MATIQFERPRETEGTRVLRWRVEELLRAAYDADAAGRLALENGVDLRAAVELVRRGCPPATALRILL